MVVPSTTADFSDYVETTVDPGWSWTVIISTLSILVNLSVPLLVRIGKRWDQRREQRKQQEESTSNDHRRCGDSGADNDESANGDQKQDNTLEGSSSESQSSMQQRRRNMNKYLQENNKASENDHNLSDNDLSSVGSSAIVSDMASSVIGAGRRTKKARKHKLMQQRENERLQRDPTPDISLESASFDDDLAVGVDDDDITPSEVDSVSKAKGAQNTTNDRPVPLCDFSITKSIDALIDASDWDKEMKKVWFLAKPYTIEAFCESIFATATVGIIGHFIGVREASAYVVATIMIEFTATINYGFPEALDSLGPQALGAGKDRLVGQYIQLGAILYVVGCIPIVLLWSFLAEDTILWLGFDSETARIGQGYMVAYSIIETIDGVEDCLHSYLDFSDHEYYSTAFSLIGYSSDLLLFLSMGVFGQHDLVKIGIIQIFMQIFILVLNFAIVSYKGWIDEDVFEGLFKTNAFKVSLVHYRFYFRCLRVSPSYKYVAAHVAHSLLNHCSFDRTKRRFRICFELPFPCPFHMS